VIDRNAMAPYDALFTGHEAGYWSLPDDVLRARRALDTLDVRRAVARADLAEADHRRANYEAAQAVAALAVGGRKVPEHPGEPLVAFDERRQLLAFDEGVLSEARTIAADALLRVLGAGADRIVRETLRPAFEEVVRMVCEQAPAVAGIDLTADTGWTASESVREARQIIDGLVPRWVAVLDAHARLLGIKRESAAYSPIRTIDEVYPNRRPIMGRVAPAPWPTGTDRASVAARLVYYLTAEGIDLWLPTLAEEREAFDEAEAGRRKMPRIMASEPDAMSGVVVIPGK
jgi:hypothetical protein